MTVNELLAELEGRPDVQVVIHDAYSDDTYELVGCMFDGIDTRVVLTMGDPLPSDDDE